MQRENNIRKSVGSVALSLFLFLGACDVSTPSQVNVTQIQVRETVQTFQLSAEAVEEKTVVSLADRYLRNGEGLVSVLIGYRQDQQGDITRANRQARLYRMWFKRHGVSSVETDIVPVDGIIVEVQTLVSYQALIAEAPEGCTQMPSKYGAVTTEEMDKYGIGCELNTIVGKMVSKPADLLGRTSKAIGGDSRRQGVVVEQYKTGVRNVPLQGFSASETEE